MKFIVLGLLLTTFTFSAHAQIEFMEDAIESAYVELLLNNNGQGKVNIPDCDICPSLYIDKNTRAYFEGKPISLQEARLRARNGATVIYDIKTRAITRIIM